MIANKFECFYKVMVAANPVKQDTLIRDFLMSLTGDELWAWNQFMFKKSDLFMSKLKTSDLTEDDKQFFTNWFDKFDHLALSIKSKPEERKAA